MNEDISPFIIVLSVALALLGGTALQDFSLSLPARLVLVLCSVGINVLGVGFDFALRARGREEMKNE